VAGQNATCSVSAKKLSGCGRAPWADDLTGTAPRARAWSVEQVDALEPLVLGVGHDLDREVPLGVVAGLDGVGQVATVEVGVGAGELDASSQTSECTPSLGFQWNFTNVGLPPRR
jgi:hypothetical protein